MNDYEFSYNGLLLGGDTDYGFVSVEGLADQPDLRTSDRTRLRRHGQIPGDDFLDSRSIVAQFELFGASDAAFLANMNALKLALAPGSPEAPFSFQVPGVAGGGTRRVNARPRKLALPVERDRFFYRMPVATVQLNATDPRIYDDLQQSQNVGLAAGVAGHAWDNTWNFSWGGATTSTSIFAVNAGTFPTPFVVRFDGPVTNPSIENVGTGDRLALNLALGSGEFLVIDTDARTVFLGGTASRYSSLTSANWFDLLPGTTQLRFAGTTAGSPLMTVTWRSAWL